MTEDGEETAAVAAAEQGRQRGEVQGKTKNRGGIRIPNADERDAPKREDGQERRWGREGKGRVEDEERRSFFGELTLMDGGEERRAEFAKCQKKTRGSKVQGWHNGRAARTYSTLPYTVQTPRIMVTFGMHALYTIYHYHHHPTPTTTSVHGSLEISSMIQLILGGDCD